MHFDLVQTIRVPLAVVEAASIDPEFLRQLGGLGKLGRPELLEQRQQGVEVWQRVRYAFQGDVSAAVRAVVDPQQLTWVQESTLDRTSHVTTFVIRPDRYPGLLDAHGEMRLTPGEDVAGSTVRHLSGDVRVHIPFVGRRVESVIVDGMREHTEGEVAALEQWAAARRSTGAAGS